MANPGIIPYNGETHYDLSIGTIERRLPVIRLNPVTWIASFVMLGDVALIEHCAELLCRKVSPDYDVIAVPEAKAIPLAHSMARLCGRADYCVMRKSVKSYMSGELSVPVDSITTGRRQRLYLDGADAERIKGRRVLLVDDVISTGGTLAACAGLIEAAGGRLHQAASALMEGEAWAGAVGSYGTRPAVHLAAIPVFVTPDGAA
ncbi:MAG: adenine phosphoribosyltransferase [Deltaproteobacteria bacterium]|nr:adenine phosphoribosyltransferase [Deltaproteobacteria bacterium]